MTNSLANLQFEGKAINYPVPDTEAHFHRAQGMVDLTKNKRAKSTYLSEIIDNAKKPGNKPLGPTDYDMHLALDFTKLPKTKRYQWNKMNKTSFVDDIEKREKKMKGPADYVDGRI